MFSQIGHLEYRFHLFAAVILATAIIVWFRHWSFIKLGIDPNHILKGLLPYSVFTLLGVAYIITLAKVLKYKPTTNWWAIPHFTYGFILMSISQEFLYRSFLIPELQSISHSFIFVVFINALLFTFIHIIYPNKTVNLITAFIGGLCFAGIYYYYPNLILASLSHMVLNFLVVFFGMFTFEGDNLVPKYD